MKKIAGAILATLLICACRPVYTQNLGEQLIVAAREGKIERVEKLLAKGADVNAGDIAGQTALMYAAGEGHSEIAEFLIEQGANVDVKNKAGRTALMIAETLGHSEIARLLKEAGAVESNE